MRLCCGIITRNSPAELRETLKSLLDFRLPVVVSDDSDETFAQDTITVCLQLGVDYEIGPHRGPVANRLAVAMRVRELKEYSHVLFLDDDMTLTSSVLQSLSNATVVYPDDIITVAFLDGEDGPLIMPTVVNWKGIRSIPAPLTGGAGLSDACMLWPMEAIEKVEWDSTLRYGYAEAWLGAQVYAKGINIRILPGIMVLHRQPGRETIFAADLETARCYYNFLIKALEYGRFVAIMLFVADFFLSNGKRWVHRRPLIISSYKMLGICFKEEVRFYPDSSRSI